MEREFLKRMTDALNDHQFGRPLHATQRETREAFNELSLRKRNILTCYFRDKMTLVEIAEREDRPVTRQAIHLYKHNAFEQMDRSIRRRRESKQA